LGPTLMTRRSLSQQLQRKLRKSSMMGKNLGAGLVEVS
jgi:hypothetical protein